MKHRFEYRIGRHARYSEEQWRAAAGKTVSESLDDLNKTVPAQWGYNVYAVIVNDEEKVIKISKHPCQVMSRNSLELMSQEIALHGRAVELPVFNRDDFGVWDYFIINSDDIDEWIVRVVIESLDRGEE